VDFSEDPGKNRDSTLATLHYGAGDSRVQRALSIDLTKWHTFGVEWTPNFLVYTVDGQTWGRVDSSDVPAIPMALAMQTQVWPCGHTWEACPNSSTPSRTDLQVDWVSVYSYNS